MDFADNTACDIGLSLGLGLQVQSINRSELRVQKKKEYDSMNCNKYNNNVFPSLTLGLSDDHHQIKSKNVESVDFHPQASSPSAASSFSNSRSSSIKKERDSVGEEVELEVENKVLRNAGDLDDDGSPRKKLRLTKEQSAVLEDSFKEHSSLNPKQKQELARKLNLRTRQVEVWFQNRRARTKLKQTEVDCELLKKSCETLTEENKRLQKEIQELKSMKTSPRGPVYMQLPAATLTVCPFCERICSGGRSGGGSGGDGNGSSPATPIFIGSKAHHFYKSNHPFTHSSAAC